MRPQSQSEVRRSRVRRVGRRCSTSDATTLLRVAGMACAAAVTPAWGQMELPSFGTTRTLADDTGALDNPTNAWVTLDMITVENPDGAWMRLQLDRDTVLPPGSKVRFTALQDGSVMELDQSLLDEWNYATAGFNGSIVVVELIGGPHSVGNRLKLASVAFEDARIFGERDEDSDCGIFGTDDRVRTTELFTGRLFGTKADGTNSTSTGSSFCINNTTMVSCGHCVNGVSNISISYHVPSSITLFGQCVIQFPLAQEQFPITTMAFAHDPNVDGQDWSVLRVGRNWLNQLPQERYGPIQRGFLSSTPRVGRTVGVVGYGVDSNCPDNSTQQTSFGLLTQVAPFHLRMTTDVRPGNSGSGLFDGPFFVGIVSHCAEQGSSVDNKATRLDVPAFEQARRSFGNNCEGALPPVPSNDAMNNPTVLTQAFTSLTATNQSATNSVLVAAIDGTRSARDMWYSYTPVCDGSVRFDTCGSTFNTTLAVLDASTGSLIEGLWTGSNSAGASCDPMFASLQFPVNSQTTYLIRVAGEEGAYGTFVLRRTIQLVAPANDSCSTATPVSVGQTYLGSTSCANVSNPNGGPCGLAGGKDVYYSFTPTLTGTYTIDACGSNTGLDYNVTLSLLNGACGPELACSMASNQCNQQPVIVRTLNAGQTYGIRVAYTNFGEGNFRLNIGSDSVVPANDACAGATPLLPVSGTVSFNTTNATQQGALGCLPTSLNKDVWYIYTPPQRGRLYVTTAAGVPNSLDSGLTIFGGCGGQGLACSSDMPGSPWAAAVTATTPEPLTPLLIRVSTNQFTAGQFYYNFTPLTCNDIDFNNDSSVFDPTDITDFLSVYSEGPCSTGPIPGCDSIDFNNDGSLYDPRDIESFLSVYGEGPCL